MDYLFVKTIHLLSMVLLFGTGLGSAWYKWMADRSGDLRHIAITNRQVVLADWIFTTPTVLIQPLTGLWLAELAGWPLSTGWIAVSLGLYALAALCWLPVVWLQIRMRRLSEQALAGDDECLDPLYERYQRVWFALGVPAFLSMLAIVWLMVHKTPGV